MKQPFIFLFLLLSLPVFSQQVWSPDSSATAKNKAYAGLGLDWQKGQDKGNVFSIAAEYGRILNKNASLGVSGRVMWYATTSSGTAFNIHPFLRLHTSFPLPFPNLFVDIGYASAGGPMTTGTPGPLASKTSASVPGWISPWRKRSTFSSRSVSPAIPGVWLTVSNPPPGNSSATTTRTAPPGCLSISS